MSPEVMAWVQLGTVLCSIGFGAWVLRVKEAQVDLLKSQLEEAKAFKAASVIEDLKVVTAALEDERARNKAEVRELQARIETQSLSPVNQDVLPRVPALTVSDKELALALMRLARVDDALEKARRVESFWVRRVDTSSLPADLFGPAEPSEPDDA